MPKYSPPERLDGKVAIVTGGNAGIGYFTAKAFADAGATVVLGCRSIEKAEAAVEKLKAETNNQNISFLQLDTSDLDSVRKFAEEFESKFDKLHLLINNAGIGSIADNSPNLSKQGFELVFATNHLGHYLLTRLLLPLLKFSAPSRIVNVASKAHGMARDGIPFDKLKSPGSYLHLSEYGVSKLANIMFSISLAEKLEGTGVTSYSLHPGVVATDIWKHMPYIVQKVIKFFMLSEEDGAATSVYCATAPEAALKNGAYYDNIKEAKINNKHAFDKEMVEKLWNISAEWTGISANL